MSIDFSQESDSQNFMHVLIKPLNYNITTKYEESENEMKLFNMANEDLSSPLQYIKSIIGLDKAKQLLTFDEEPEEPVEPWHGTSSKWPYEDPNQLKLDLKEIIKKIINNIE